MCSLARWEALQPFLRIGCGVWKRCTGPLEGVVLWGVGPSRQGERVGKAWRVAGPGPLASWA